MSSEIVIRAGEPGDQKYLFDTIRDTLLINSHYCKGLHPATLEALIEPVLATYQALVATPVDAPDQILGFLIYRDPETVAFIYVRSQLRSKPVDHAVKNGRRTGGGIARALLAKAGIARSKPGEARPPEISCAFMVTKMDGVYGQAFPALAESKGYRLRFRPYQPLEITARLHYGREVA